jgi:hypothetical protein
MNWVFREGGLADLYATDGIYSYSIAVGSIPPTRQRDGQPVGLWVKRIGHGNTQFRLVDTYATLGSARRAAEKWHRATLRLPQPRLVA